MPTRRHPAWAFTAGVVVGVGGFVAIHAVRRRTKGAPPPGPSTGLGVLPGAAGPEPVASTGGGRPTPAPDHRLRAMFLVAVLVAVTVGFVVYRHTADANELAKPYSPLIVPTARPWVLPADSLPDWPRDTSTRTPPASPPSAGLSSDPDDGIVARSGLVPRTSKVIMRRLNGDRMTVSIEDVVNAQPWTHQKLPAYPLLRPARGKRLVFVEVEVRNTGYTTFPEHVGFFRGSVSDRDGHVYQPNARLTNAVNSGPESAPLAPDWSAVGIMVFEVKESTRVTSFRFGPWPSVSRQTQEWSLADG